jgi:5-(hydroxymethyl)furfural/furfural oxidase
LGERVGALVVAVHKPFSKGVVNLSGPDPALSPKVSFNMLSDERDFHRLVEGTRFMLDVLADPEVVAARHEVFFPDGNLVHRLNRHNARNWLQAAAIAGALEPSLLRRLLLKELRIDMTALARSQDALDVLIRERAQVSHHVCGTCRMGARNDAGAVVGPSGLVWGIEGLRVVDASIFPAIPRANTHFPVLMAAERIADLIKAEWKNNNK